MRASVKERFHMKLRPVGRCFIFGKTGQSSFRLENGKDVTPRVAAWFLHYGRFPQGNLRSECGTRLCCKVGHLRDVTAERGARPAWQHSEIRPTAILHLTFIDLNRNARHAHLVEVTCPVCGGPPTFGTCPSCEMPYAA